LQEESETEERESEAFEELDGMMSYT